MRLVWMTCGKARLLVPMLAVLALFQASPAVAGGVLKATARFEGAAPAMRPIDMGKDKACVDHYKEGTPPVGEMLVLGENQAMANVLMEVVSGLPEGVTYPVPEEPVQLTQEGCRYSPRVFVVRAGQTLKIKNPDGTLHNVNAQPKVNPPFNRGMPANVTEFDVVFEKPEPLFPFACNVHPWMQAHCAVLDHPYFGVTDTTGTIEINDLPAGKYELRATHEVLGEKTVSVTIEEGKEATVDFVFERPARKP